MKEIKKDPFDEYIKNLPPTRKELGQAWRTAIGLQDVDGLQPSAYLYETAKKNIDGEISVDEAGSLIDSYYESKDDRLESEARTEEADKVSARITKLLSDRSFIFSTTQYISIHRELFTGIYSHAGKIRDYNISKKEWVLDGDSVSYGGAIDLRETLEYDISQERNFRFNGLTMDEAIHHLAIFISRLWQIHVFGDGNGRMSRLLTLLLLYRSKYIVGKYISIEKMIETTKDTYPLDVIEQMNLHANKDSAFSKYMDDVIFKLRTPLMLSKLATELREGY